MPTHRVEIHISCFKSNVKFRFTPAFWIFMDNINMISNGLFVFYIIFTYWKIFSFSFCE